MSDEPYNNDADQHDAAPLTGDALGAFDVDLPDSDSTPAFGFATVPPDEPLESPRLSEEGWPILFDDAPSASNHVETSKSSTAAFDDTADQWNAFQASDAVAMPAQFGGMTAVPQVQSDGWGDEATEDVAAGSSRSKRKKRNKKAKAERGDNAAASAQDQSSQSSKSRKNKASKNAQNASDASAASSGMSASSAALSGAYADQNSAYAANDFAGAPSKAVDTPNYDFLWESDNAQHMNKGDVGTTTVVESDTDYLLLPHPDVFNAYPPEVQRKIMEWADRDVRARRDDESLRQDALIRAQAARERVMMAVPVAIIILCIVCAAITGLFTRSAAFVVAFLIVAVAVILAIYFTRKNDLYARSESVDEEEVEG